MDKIIRNFNLDLSDLSANGEIREFSIVGDNNAEFTLEIKDNTTGYYYNFVTETFQATKTKLEESIISEKYTGYINFPSTVTTDTVNGDFSSGATAITMDTAVATKMAVGDRVTGNSVLDAGVFTVATIDSTNVFSLNASAAINDGELLYFSGDDQYDIYLYAVPGTRHVDRNEVRFGDGTIDLNSSTGSNSLLIQKVLYQYSNIQLTMSLYSPGGTITGFTNTDATLNISRSKSQNKFAFSISSLSQSTKCWEILKQPEERDLISFVETTVGSAPELLPGENQYPSVTGTDTVNGAVTSGTSVTMDTAVASTMKVGDRITGNTALNAATVTVVSLDSTNAFTMSEAIALADGLTLSFSNQKNYKWPMANVDRIQSGMIVVPATNVTANSMVKNYEDTVTIFENTKKEEKIIKSAKGPLDIKSAKPTVVKGLVTTQTGSVVFNNQQVLAFAGDTVQIGGYGAEEIKRIYDWDVRVTDLKVSLGDVKAVTTAACVGSTSVAIDERDGILNSVSTVSGIGIDPSAREPLVSSGASATGSGTIVLDKAQNIENGATLTFKGAGKRLHVTGNIEIIKAGIGSPTFRFDLNRIAKHS